MTYRVTPRIELLLQLPFPILDTIRMDRTTRLSPSQSDPTVLGKRLADSFYTIQEFAPYAKDRDGLVRLFWIHVMKSKDLLQDLEERCVSGGECPVTSKILVP